MQYRHLFPMVRLLLPFISGIILSVFTSASIEVPVLLWISVAVILLLLFLSREKIPRRFQAILFGIFINLFLFIAGYNHVISNRGNLKSNHFSRFKNQVAYIARVAEPWQEKNLTYKTIVRVNAVYDGKTVTPAEGLLLTYIAKDSSLQLPEEGSVVALSAKAVNISLPANPGTFNYQRYMANNNVFQQIYLKSHEWKILQLSNHFNIKAYSHHISDKLVNILKENGLHDKEFAVASALLLGQSDRLDSETYQAYSGAGVMHILSVSGMHVGIIYAIFYFLLGIFGDKKWMLRLKFIILITIVWAYAFITGLSPSVLRAAVMFTFITIGTASRRDVHILNSLAVSALVLLIYNPLLITNVGFQLSYLAIVGIVFVNSIFIRYWDAESWISRHFRDLVTVSISAQIATAPLAIYYFHQFPLYFLPANLIAIDLSFFAMVAGMAVLATSPVSIISNFLGTVANYCFIALNKSVSFIESLPLSVININSLSAFDILLIYIILTIILLHFYFKHKYYFLLLLSFILILSISISARSTVLNSQKKLIVYQLNKASATGIIEGRLLKLSVDTALLSDQKNFDYQIGSSMNSFGIKQSMINAFASSAQNSIGNISKEEIQLLKNNMLIAANKRIISIDRLPEADSALNKLKTDYLIIRHNPKLKIGQLLRFYTPDWVIFDGSNSKYHTQKWSEECKIAGIKHYSTRDSGAFIADL